MADRRATNKYYPPDWDPSKGSINKHYNSHPLRKRANKIDQGILVVRFEMPFNIWCLGCDKHVGMGVRYNAEKSRVGNYYTSPIYQFKMKCHLCDNYFLIKTDPAKFDYEIVEGARRQILSTVESEDLESQSAYERAEEAKRRLTNSMYKLERKIEDKMASDISEPNLRDIMKWRSLRADSFSANQLVRAQFRRKRKSIEQDKERDRRLLQRTSLKIALAETSKADKSTARVIMSQAAKERLVQSEASKRAEILSTSKFISNGPKRCSKSKRPHHNHLDEAPSGSTRSRVQKITNL